MRIQRQTYFQTTSLSFQAKLAARKNRRQQDQQRQAQEEAAQRILDEQAQLALQSKPADAVDHIVIPNIVAGQSPEEMVCILFNN